MFSYDDMKRRLRDPKGWDVDGLIEDIRAHVENADEKAVLAVIDYLMEFRTAHATKGA